MQLYFDLNVGSLVVSPGFTQPVSNLSFKRGDSQTITLQFCKGGSIVDLPDPASSGIFGIKRAGDYDGDYLVAALSWAKSGAGVNAVYSFAPSFNTTELNAFIDNAGNPSASVTCMGEIQWTTTAGLVTSSNTFSAVIANDVIKGAEGVPTSGTPAYPAPGVLVTSTLGGIISLASGVQDYAVDITAHGLAAAPSFVLLQHLPHAATDAALQPLYVSSLTTATNLALHVAQAPTDDDQKVAYLLVP